jgi:AraC-like DNA-binding protein
MARRHVVDHDSRPDSRLNFQARLASSALGELTLVSFRTSSMRISHAERHLARAADELFICRQTHGALHLEQNGRSVTLQPGDMTLIDPRMTYEGRLSEDADLLVLRVPRRQVAARVGPTDDMTAFPLRSVHGTGSLAAEFLALLPAHADALGDAASIVADQALDLFAAALSSAMGKSNPRLSSARLLVLTQLRAAIERDLADTELTPERVAGAAGVSVRYANAVLAADNTSITRMIQARRLDRCKRALADPLQAQRSIADIAYRWGFSDMTHFARRFRTAYGALPSEYRAQIRALNK